ncbi:LysM peptidoglycan-binding domain-containing protein [Paenibacillus lacisoli]|uniref:LysM peptidoglycan-binding domain-containing protein n=1 Tax=Paenibacillus lacisoli TaxID=3064525 RepID=UPI00387ED004
MNQPYGLRFDIYERVQLSEELPGIQELEEIELLPRIQVVAQGEHAALRGHLLLSGVYRAEEGEAEELEHLIPVEITIPLNRVARLEEVAVEIETFDVDLLSVRTLNITGVLSLQGVGSLAAEEQSWQEDEFTVVHAPNQEEGLYNNQEFKEQEEAEKASRLWQQEQQQAQAQQAYEQELYEQQLWSQQQFYNQQQGYQQQSFYQPENAQQLGQQPWYTQQPLGGQQTRPEDELQPSFNIAQEFSGLWNRQPASEEQEPEPIETEIEEIQTWSIPAAVSQRQPEEVNGQPAAITQEAADFGEFSEKTAAESTPAAAGPSAASISWLPEEREVSSQSDEAKLETEETFAEAVPTVTLEDDQQQPSDPSQEVWASASLEEERLEPELKIAWGSKKPEQMDNAAPALSTVFHTDRPAREAESMDLSAQPEKPVLQESYPAEDLKWKHLFFGSRVEQTPFKKVRLCIVQREETLESIAERYQLSLREIQLFNRMTEQQVVEGQVLYIP